MAPPKLINKSIHKPITDLPLLPHFFERILLNWADKRQHTAQQQQTISNKQLYILPTRNGITYFIVLLLILFGAINYENSLGYMLAFLLGSLGFIGMIYTHQSINQLNIKIHRAEPVFAGQNLILPLVVSRQQKTTSPNIKLLSETGQISTLHLIDEKETNVKLELSTHQRGYISVGRIKIFSEFPLGLFHAWSWLKLDSRCLVYPAPATHHYPLNASQDINKGATQSNQPGVDDFSDIRKYHIGDLPTYMAWKAIAKTGTLQTKVFTTDVAQHIWINWTHTDETLNMEKRLSILCRMILDASEKNITYGLNIPTNTLQPSTGLQHKQQCLKALALYGKPA